MTYIKRIFVHIEFKGGSGQNIRVKDESAAFKAIEDLKDLTRFAKIGDRIITPADVDEANVITTKTMVAA